MGVQIDQVVARFPSTVTDMAARPNGRKPVSPAVLSESSRIRSESALMMYFRNNRLEHSYFGYLAVLGLAWRDPVSDRNEP